MKSLLTAIGALAACLVATSAVAAPTKQALDAAAEAVYLDFARDGVVASPDEVRGKYQEACDLGYELACRSERWHDADGLAQLDKASAVFEKACGRQDPVACAVAGWAIEAQDIPRDLDVGESRQRKLDQLKDASDKYFAGCQSKHWSACLELGRYSYARYALGLDDNNKLERYKRGARDMYRTYCRWDNQRACVLRGELEDQAPELLDKRDSAGFLYRRACDEGYTQGCYRQGLLVAPLKSTAENRHWFDGLCDRGHTASCEWVARSYDTDPGAPLSDEALSAWKRACLLHSPRGCSIAGPALEQDRPAEAIQVHRMGCALGEGTACGRLGLMLVAQDQHASAIRFLDSGCESGHVRACVEGGLLRIEGVHVEANPQAARQGLLKGCPEDGERHPDACNALGRVYQAGMGGERDRAKAAGYFRLACKDGHLPSCFQVGESVMQLQRTSRSDKLLEWALEGYAEACEAGMDEACLPAAELYATGPISVRDYDQARSRFEQLLDKGLPIAARRYGEFLRRQAKDDDDLARAREVFREGSELGDAESTRQLGLMLHEGVGGPRKRGKARRLFRQACRDGNALACGGADVQQVLVRP